MPKEFKIDQINVSDDKYLLSSLDFKDSDLVKNGDIIFSYESSKADLDVESDTEGYIYYNDGVSVNNEYEVGTIICIINEEKIEDKSVLFKPIAKSKKNKEDFIITKKAKVLIEKNNIDTKIFSNHEIINEKIVNEFLEKESSVLSINNFYNKSIKDLYNLNIFKNKKTKKLAIVGAGKAALQLYDAIDKSSYEPKIYYEMDNQKVGKSLFGSEIHPYNIEKISNDFRNGVFDEIIISFTGDINSRSLNFEELKKHDLKFANIIHPKANISPYIEIGEGNVIFSNTRIGPFSKILNNNILSAYCNIEHNNIVKSNNTFGPGVMTSGSCVIGNKNKFGTGVFIEPKINIGNNCIVASGVILTRNINSNTLIKNINNQQLNDL
tara:strand:+ start:634 stop:1776 length:1143 start_codon:yes stop_codon:yes gene_type:complete